MNGRDVDVGEVERELGDAVLLDVPTDAFDRLKGAGNADGFAFLVKDGGTGDAVALFDSACFTDVKRNGVRPAARGGVQVDVVRDEEVARTNGCGPGSAGRIVEFCRTEVWCAFVRAQLAQPLVLAFAAHGEVFAFWTLGG